MQLSTSVLLTLSYSHIFSKPLTQTEISLRLIQKSYQKLDPVLTVLQNKKMITKNGELWQLQDGRRSLAELRKRRERLSGMKLQELAPFVNFARAIPWVRGIAVTGSVSVTNADAKDDVDLMIIVQARRLWLVRPLLVLFSFIKGKRRSWNHEESNSWCLNLWLEEQSMSVQPDKRSIYTAYEVCQARWLFSTSNAQYRFLHANDWVSGFLPTYFASELDKVPKKEPQKTPTLFDGLLSALNSGAYSVQRWYMQRHMTTERVGLSYAFFHPRDTKRSIFDRWKDLITAL